MIIYSLRCYEVNIQRVAEFAAGFREGGLVYESFRHFPGHIHTDLLFGIQNTHGCRQLLSISFYTSIESLLRAENSDEMQAVVRWLQQRMNHCYHLGAFSFFPTQGLEIVSMEIAGQSCTEFTRSEVQT